MSSDLRHLSIEEQRCLAEARRRGAKLVYVIDVKCEIPNQPCKGK